MGEKGNGHDPMTVRMVEVLEQIRDEIQKGFAETHARIDKTNNRIDALTKITETAFRHVHERIDEAHEEAIRNTERATGPQGLEARVQQLADTNERMTARLALLEQAVFKKASCPRAARALDRLLGAYFTDEK